MPTLQYPLQSPVVSAPPSPEPMPVVSENEPKVTKITNCKILRDHKIVEQDAIWIQAGKIIDPHKFFWYQKRLPDVVLDAKGLLVVPGFIETQINGAFGVDFSVPSDDTTYERDLMKVNQGLLKYGTTSYCPTIVSSSAQVYHRVLSHLKPRAGSAATGATVLGAHVEGPFINEARIGAHELKVLQNSAKNGYEDFKNVYGLEGATPEDQGELTKKSQNSVKIITCAPELDGIMESIPDLVKAGITVSVGHSMANTAQAENAVEKGATFITHLFNAMPQFHHRDPGVIGLLGSRPDLPRPYYGLICDGIHVHPNSVKIAYDSHPEGVILVTDAMSAMGLAPGNYQLGNMSVTKEEDRVYIEGTDTLAGRSEEVPEFQHQHHSHCRHGSSFDEVTTATEHARMAPASIPPGPTMTMTASMTETNSNTTTSTLGLLHTTASTNSTLDEKATLKPIATADTAPEADIATTFLSPPASAPASRKNILHRALVDLDRVFAQMGLFLSNAVVNSPLTSITTPRVTISAMRLVSFESMRPTIEVMDDAHIDDDFYVSNDGRNTLIPLDGRDTPDAPDTIVVVDTPSLVALSSHDPHNPPSGANEEKSAVGSSPLDQAAAAKVDLLGSDNHNKENDAGAEQDSSHTRLEEQQRKKDKEEEEQEKRGEKSNGAEKKTKPEKAASTSTTHTDDDLRCPYSSVITLDACIRNFIKFTNCSIIEALEAVTLHPATLLGIQDQKGVIKPGADADLVFLSDDLFVKRVFVAGEEVDLEAIDVQITEKF
ncbi:hypothetical protein DFQ26_008629 [Actinomortierella ambigua]|nr:hypothetical protein DFQ26_008629 [Actinomortierella ambigua]